MNCMRTAVTVLVAVMVAACADDTRDALAPNFAPGGRNPTVTGTTPTGADQDTTLDVRVSGSNFDHGSRADFAKGGVVGPKVVTNATQYVSSTELVANITIAVDADTGAYDVIVTASTGKKGIGTELFAVRSKGPKPPVPFDPAIVYSDGGHIRVADALGVYSVDLGLRKGTGWPRWAPGGSGTLADPYRIAVDTALAGQSCNRLIIADVDSVGGQPRVASRRSLDLPPQHMACFIAWSPAGDTLAYAAVQVPAVGNGLWLVPAAGGAPVRVLAATNAVVAPTWAPDGTALAFQETAPGGTNAIRVFNRPSGNVTTLVPFGTLTIARGPDWSADNAQVAFTAVVTKGNRSDLYVYTVAVTRSAQGDYVAAGSAQRRFLGDSPAWSSDGSQMVVNGLYIADVATGTRTRVVTGDWADWRW